MGSPQNLHRIMGSTFQHAKPGLCECCAFRRPHGEWEGYCTTRGKILSYKAPGKGKSRCGDYVTDGASEEPARDEAALPMRVATGAV